MRAAVILGAGFSKNSGLPVQSEIPELLIKDQYDTEFENAISIIIKRFYEHVFGFSKGSVPPSLDDILTCIDISTNSGHHLGMDYSSMHLRTVRRALDYRLFTILQERYSYSEDVMALIRILTEKYSKLDFIVLNWDTVLENYIKLLEPGFAVDYCNGGIYWRKHAYDKSLKAFKIIKIHGSCNWLYCDNCRVLINDSYNEIPLIKRAGFKEKDFELFDEFKGMQGFLDCEKCLICKDNISSHIATLSFRKSFRENSFPQLWNQAEEVLSDADKWIFIGYSLPQADYEFKHLMKISELKFKHIRKREIEIEVVLLNSTSTVSKYKSFFGDRKVVVYNDGINGYLKYI